MEDKDFTEQELKNVEKVRDVLKAIGEDVTREGLVDTPKRIVKMWREIFRGYHKEQLPKVTTFENGKDGIVCNEMITDEGDFYSHCEHHFLPFIGGYKFGYIPHPKGKILGLSKVARVVDYFSAKAQIQERLTHEILKHIEKELSKDCEYSPLGIAVVMKAEHLCKTMRGVKKKGQMTTKFLTGVFKNDEKTRNEFLGDKWK